MSDNLQSDTPSFQRNPAHPIGTCSKCGEEMVYNVPRLGPAGGFVHRMTGDLECAPAVLLVAANRRIAELEHHLKVNEDLNVAQNSSLLRVQSQLTAALAECEQLRECHEATVEAKALLLADYTTLIQSRDAAEARVKLLESPHNATATRHLEVVAQGQETAILDAEAKLAELHKLASAHLDVSSHNTAHRQLAKDVLKLTMP